jgi:hypothetical protein
MRKALAAAGAVLALAFLTGEAAAQTCDCTTVTEDTCSGDGYRVALVNFRIDQLNGTSHWDYRVCNVAGTEICPMPGHPFSHVSVGLPEVGRCLSPEQDITIAQLSGFDAAVLTCTVATSDPTCNIFGMEPGGYQAKCDVVAGSVLDPGECVTVRLSLAGEMPTLGAGITFTRTRAEPAGCFRNCMLGPSCHPCTPPPPPDQCLSRTPGFWGTHPHITALFLPVTVCGETLDGIDAGSCSSVTEALCVAPGNELKKLSAYAQLVRQLAAAKLNLNASVANGGTCGEAIAARIAECEALYCGASQSAISSSGCIEDLDAFNNSQDTFPMTPSPFDRPGPANSQECQEANGNKLVIGKGSCL